MITNSNRWSDTMPVGFIAALLAYGSLLLPATATDDTRYLRTETRARPPAG